MTALLEARGLCAGYGATVVVRDLDLEVRPGEVVALLGPNGAGKTTTLLTMSGELPVLAGEVWFDGRRTTAMLHRRARRGLALVTEERSTFMQLSTLDNLRVGRCDVTYALALFPELEALLGRRAGLLSGGEQQMLALARALARRPKLLLADELSLGLAPIIVQRLLRRVREAADRDGVGVLMVEQHVKQALELADRIHVIRRGRIVRSGRAGEITAADLHESYLTSAPAHRPVVPVLNGHVSSVPA